VKKGNWKELTPGAVVMEPGSTHDAVETGSWRLNRPIIDLDRCINCFFCWMFCPDAAILVTDHKVSGIDYEHCKGCGICSVECPPKCIEMVLDKD
jgi:pyruvate ferredoxin oxidoreductase delta subunit